MVMMASSERAHRKAGDRAKLRRARKKTLRNSRPTNLTDEEWLKRRKKQRSKK